MDDLELLECLIYTKIYDTKYRKEIANRAGNKKLELALLNKLTGLQDSLDLLCQVREGE